MTQFRYRFLLSLLTVVVLVAGSEPVSAQQPLNLDSCIQEARANNPQISRAQQQVQQSELQRRQASGALLPSLSLNGAFSRYTSVSPQRLLNPATNQIVEGSSTALTSMTYYSGLNLSQSLYNKSITALYTQARAGDRHCSGRYAEPAGGTAGLPGLLLPAARPAEPGSSRDRCRLQHRTAAAGEDDVRAG